MLTIIIPGVELWDEKNQEFIYGKEQTLQLEHSLVSLSKWESKWCKPFLSKAEKTDEEILDYIKFMTITQNVNPEVYLRLSNDNIKRINDYISHPATATTFSQANGGKKSNEIVTSELIYYWMTALNIPFECQKWHLNRLLTLIRIANIKNAPPKKMSKRETMSRYQALNAARRKQLNSKG
ncbi:MAG: hypothetical protein J6Q84_07330 [Kiritimatiellae bacterium]|nr:hypothetical protein [Kiritimatiellia bacterium]